MMAASFYSKNFYTFLIVCPPVFLYLMLRRRWKACLSVGFLLGLITVLLVIPWAWAVYKSGGWDYLRVVFVDNTIGRFFRIPNLAHIDIGPLNDAYVAEKGKPIYFYLGTFVTMTQPWLLLFILASFSLFSSIQKDPSHDDVRTFLKITLITIPIVLSLSSSKVAEYLFPLLFILFLILGDYLKGVWDSVRPVGKIEHVAWGITLGVLMVGVVAIPAVLAILVKQPWALLWYGPLASAGWALWRFAGRSSTPPAPLWVRVGPHGMTVFLLLLMAGLTVLLSQLYPYLEQQKSYRFFFDEIRPMTDRMRVYSTYCDDRRLPLINFYLNRRVEIVPKADDPLKPLLSSSSVGVIMSPGLYEEHQRTIEQNSWTVIPTRMGKRAFVFIGNHEIHENTRKEE